MSWNRILIVGAVTVAGIGCDPLIISGTITYHGSPPPGIASWVMVDTADGEWTGIVEPADADGNFEVRVSEGEYRLYGVVDTDRSESPGPPWYDVMGYDVDGPVAAPAEGVQINVESAYPWIASCFDGEGAYLVGIGAQVLSPATAESIADEASVTVTGGDEPIELDEEAHAREWVPYCDGGIPLNGPTEYTFRVSHPSEYQPPYEFVATATPREERPAIDHPGDGDVATAGSPLSVSWISPRGEGTLAWIQLFSRAEDAPGEPIWDEIGPSPLEIPGGALGTPGPYAVTVMESIDEYLPEGGASQAWSIDEVAFGVALP